MDNQQQKTGFKIWLLIWGLGLAGQICWAIENQWFNTFVYAKIGKDPNIITWMLSISALATTFATFFFGTWADRTGKRRLFIAWGYILWGVFTICFGLTDLISRENYLIIAASVVLADMIMSFFGSMGNDAGFNTWINDVMTDRNRGQIGGAMATQPVLGVMLATVIGGMLIGENDNYMLLFAVMGGLVIVFGLISLLALGKKDDVTPSIRGTFWQQFLSVFNFKQLFRQKELLLVNVGLAVAFSGFNVFFAYVGNYVIYYLGYSASDLGLIEAIPLGLSMLTAIPLTPFINKGKHPYVALLGVLVCAAGLTLMWPIGKPAAAPTGLFHWQLWLGIFLAGMGYVAMLQSTKVWTKQLYPRDSKGQYEGIWIIFFVLIPMVVGSILGGEVVKSSGEAILNATSGQMEYIPNGTIFLAGAVCLLLSLLPFGLAAKQHQKALALK